MEPDILYLACTRGAKTTWGVPAMGFYINCGVAYLGYMTFGEADPFHFHGYVWGVLFIAAHFGMIWAVEQDPNCVRLIEVMFDTGFNRVLWSAPHALSRRTVTSAV